MPDEIREINYLAAKTHYNVVVVGGGISGVAAAVSAVRRAASVLLIEKGTILGGLAACCHDAPTAGYEGKLPGGIPGELSSIIKKHLASPGESRAAGLSSALEKYLSDEGIDTLFDTLFSKTVMHDGLCEGVIIETCAGREYITSDMVVDATGVACVMHRSGASCAQEDDYSSHCSITLRPHISRRLCGIYELTETDRTKNFEDSIGFAASDNSPECTLEIPYSSLVTRELKNIIAAGRSISLSGAARKFTRSAAVSAVTGQAAGAACCLALEKNTCLADIPIDLLKAWLTDFGTPLHYQA